MLRAIKCFTVVTPTSDMKVEPERFVNEFLKKVKYQHPKVIPNGSQFYEKEEMDIQYVIVEYDVKE